VCSEGDSFPACAAGDADVENAHDFAGDTYDFYSSMHGRDGIDDLGGPLVSTTHWTDGVSCPNAFWNGEQMVYCESMADADDVVAHEFTHGVTDHESQLLYYYQSGAINESLSDVWGELIDLWNEKGDDSPSVRWLLGEDLGFTIRDMKDPGTHGDPDRMTSSNYWLRTYSSWFDDFDNGGVHHNSGVNNKAAYLLTDGDSFNGVTVTGLGIAKTAKIYYEAQTHLLTSGSDYADLYDYLHQACLNLVGTDEITVADCDEVRDAADAVEMNLDPAGLADFSPDAAYCPANYAQGAVLFADDLETDASNWATTTLSDDSNNWVWLTGYATSGSHSIYAETLDTTSDSVAWNVAPISLPAGTYLYFRHSFGFEANEFLSNYDYYDGGVIEYMTDGVNWQDLGSLFADGQDYGGTISSDWGNPLAGRPGFVDESHGYVSSRYDLSSLAGQDFQVRFRLASDSSFAGPLGWAVDDVMIYQCEAQFDESCSGTDVLIQSREFTGVSTCIGDNSLAANTDVIVRAGAQVVFKSPSTTLGPGFSVETGGEFSVDTNL